MMSMKVCISLKEIYEELGPYLSEGGVIHKSSDDEDSYYDLRTESGTLLCCDGESYELISELNNLVYLENTATKYRLVLTKQEYEIGHFE